MKNRNRWIMVFAIAVAAAMVAADHVRHRPPYASDTLDGIGQDADAPCSMDLGHGEEDEEDVL